MAVHFLTMEVIIMPSAENHEKQLLNNYLNPFNVQAQNAYLVKRYLKLVLNKDIFLLAKSSNSILERFMILYIRFVEFIANNVMINSIQNMSNKEKFIYFLTYCMYKCKRIVIQEIVMYIRRSIFVIIFPLQFNCCCKYTEDQY